MLARVYRSTLPEDQRLSADQLVSDLQSAGRSARHVETVDAIVDTIVQEHRDGDVVLIMSNGGFGGIHRKLLHALQHVQR